MGKFVDKLTKNTPQTVKTVVEKVDLTKDKNFAGLVERVGQLELALAEIVDKLTNTQKEDAQKEDKQKGKKEDKKSE